MKIIRIDRLTPTGGTDSPDIGGAGAAPILLEEITRTCHVCQERKPLTDFPMPKEGLYYHACKACKAKDSRERYKRLKDNPREFVTPESKVCTKCLEDKPAERFGPAKHTLDGLQSWCKECMNGNSKRWADKNTERQKTVSAAYRKNIRETVLDAYGHACVCCGITESEFLSIDHIRGGGKRHVIDNDLTGNRIYTWLTKNNFPKDDYALLCMNCNTAKGFYKSCPHNGPTNLYVWDGLESSLRVARRLKIVVINGYGGQCECCGETAAEFLSIDHINGNGKEHRAEVLKSGKNFYYWLRDNGFPRDNLRCLCMNCNFSLGHLGYCPHTRQREELVS